MFVFRDTGGMLMPLKKYGVLKGTAIGNLRNAEDDQYQILVQTIDTLNQIAANVTVPAATHVPSTLPSRQQVAPTHALSRPVVSDIR
jgi:hypothetical protein